MPTTRTSSRLTQSFRCRCGGVFYVTSGQLVVTTPSDRAVVRDEMTTRLELMLAAHTPTCRATRAAQVEQVGASA